MSDRVQQLSTSAEMTRREFTLEAALTILAGCVITISDACGSSNSNPTSPSTTTPSDINGVISANHGHAATITGAQITDGAAITLNIQGQATHNHTLTVSQGDLQNLKNRQQVAKDSSTDAAHSHTVTFTPA
jgi:hypothetical protein